MASGTLEIIALELGKALRPLADQLSADEIVDLFAELGLQFPPALQSEAAFVNSVSTAGTAVASLVPLIEQLVTAFENGDDATVISTAAKIVDALHSLLPAIDTIATQLQGIAGSLPGVNAADVTAFAGQLAERLVEYVIVTYLEGYHPLLLRFLTLAGLAELNDIPGVAGDTTKPPYTQRRLRFDLMGTFLGGPDAYFRSVYGWGDPSFDGRFLLEQIHQLLSTLSVPADYDASATPPALSLSLLKISPNTTIAPPGMQALLQFDLPNNLSFSVPLLGGRWAIELALGLDLAAGCGIIIQPPANVTVVPPAGSLQGKLEGGIACAPSPPATSIMLVGGAGSSLTAASISLHLVSQFAATTSPPQATGSFGFNGAIKGGKLHLGTDQADGFLASILSGVSLDATFDVGFGWIAGTGFQFTGSGGLQIQLPTHISLGPVDLSAVTLNIGIQGSTFPIGLTTDISASLGPLEADVQQIGAAATISFPAGGHGNLGPAQLGFEFVPPNGVGLSVDAGVIEGGGFLYIDTAHGEYAGAMQLVFADFLGLQAIGLITTKMPDGSSGFSLLIIITVDFGAGIQLGFGFTLLAVGGLLGLNRSMLFQPLMDGIRTDAIESIMFPQNVIANATRIISDLRAIFPPQQGTFLIGPMAKLGWGEPTLISLALGVIIEIPPGDIAILGVLKLALPADDIAVLLLQVNFAGALEFDKQRLYFFASLYDSHVLFITLEGEMGLLMAWGDNANFVVSIGGFNPQFNPPPLPFPTPQRIEVDIINESYARIRCDGYFAVTSNTVQFGSQSEFFFGFSALNLSGSSGFDALIQFSPFQFTVSISTSFNVNVFGLGVYGIDMDLTLSGPTPWHAHGTASISFLFFSIGIGVDFTWGDSRNTMLPPIAVMPVLDGEYGKQSNWKAVLPNGSNLLVTLRQLNASDSAMVLHPVGTLQVSQRAVPIDLTLDKDGNQQPSDANYFTLAVTSGALSKLGTLQEQFAPAQFKNMDDATKLSQPAFVPMDSGIELAAAGNAYASGTAITRNVRYELTVIDTKLRRVVNKFYTYVGSLFVHFLSGSSVTRSVFSALRETQMQPYSDHVAVNPETFAVALVSNNTVYSPEAASFTSQAAAQDHLTQTVTNDPTLTGTLHVLPQFEVAA
jgi:hypothetical protein